MVIRISFLLAVLLGNFISSAERFRDGDRVAFIGDSITHGGIYLAWVNEFYLTRFPSEKIIFINNGISGDTVSGANSRFDWDIMTGKPNAATIMLGMNDVNRSSYGIESPSEEILKRQTDAINSYKANMVTLAARLQTNKVRLTFITPSPYDQTAALKEKIFFGVNDALSNCGEFLKARALQLGAGLVDFNGPMTALNAQIQATNAESTLVGRDRVHPGGLGHLVMAWLFLKAQGMTSTVASVDIDAGAKRVTSENASVDDLKIADEGLSFVYRARSLPLPVNDDYRAADALVPLTTDLNVETIRIRNLAAGSWTLSVDGTNLGVFSAEALSSGINIATNLLSPGQTQAQMIQKLSRDRWNVERNIRGIRQYDHSLKRANVNVRNAAAVRAYTDGIIERSKGQSAEGYYRSSISNYYATKTREAEFMNAVEQKTAAIYKVAAPLSHKVAVTPAAER